MSTLEENLSKVRELYKLEKDWNLYDADPVDKNIIYTVEQALPNLIKQPDYIFPTAANSVQLEYHRSRMYLEIEFEEDKIEWLVELKNPDTASEDTTTITGYTWYEEYYLSSLNNIIDIYFKYDW